MQAVKLSISRPISFATGAPDFMMTTLEVMPCEANNNRMILPRCFHCEVHMLRCSFRLNLVRHAAHPLPTQAAPSTTCSTLPMVLHSSVLHSPLPDPHRSQLSCTLLRRPGNIAWFGVTATTETIYRLWKALQESLVVNGRLD